MFAIKTETTLVVF